MRGSCYESILSNFHVHSAKWGDLNTNSANKLNDSSLVRRPTNDNTGHPDLMIRTTSIFTTHKWIHHHVQIICWSHNC